MPIKDIKDDYSYRMLKYYIPLFVSEGKYKKLSNYSSLQQISVRQLDDGLELNSVIDYSGKYGSNLFCVGCNDCLSTY